eukprot:1107467-Lingulodinium_polyedra.AAC.1
MPRSPDPECPRGARGVKGESGGGRQHGGQGGYPLSGVGGKAQLPRGRQAGLVVRVKVHHMADPRIEAWEALKRVGRYPKGAV